MRLDRAIFGSRPRYAQSPAVPRKFMRTSTVIRTVQPRRSAVSGNCAAMRASTLNWYLRFCQLGVAAIGNMRPHRKQAREHKSKSKGSTFDLLFPMNGFAPITFARQRTPPSTYEIPTGVVVISSVPFIHGRARRQRIIQSGAWPGGACGAKPASPATRTDKLGLADSANKPVGSTLEIGQFAPYE